MWICDPPSSTMRRASAAYSSGVYGIAGHWSRLAIAPLMEQLMTTGSSNRLMSLPPVARKTARGSYGHHPVLLPRALHPLVGRHPQAADDHRTGLARIDDVVDQVVVGGDVGVDDLPHLGEHRLPGRLRVVGRLDRRAADDVDRALGSHHRDLGARPGDDEIGLVRLAVHHVVAGAVRLADDDG